MTRLQWILMTVILGTGSVETEAAAKKIRAPRHTANNEQAQCLQRLMRATCPATKDVQQFILSNVSQCRHLASSDGETEMEVLLVRETNHLVVVQTKGAYHWPGYCRVTRYSVEAEGIRDFKTAVDTEGEKLWLVTSGGRLFSLHSNGQFFEVLTGDGDSYHTLREVAPIPGAGGVKLVAGESRETEQVSFTDMKARGKRFLKTQDHYWSLSPITGAIGR